MLKLRWVIGALAALFVGAPPPAGAVPEVSSRAATADPLMSNAARVAANTYYQRWRRYNLTPLQRHMEIQRRIQMENQQQKAYFAREGPIFMRGGGKIDTINPKVLPGQQQIR
jgi:hypothetical protein